MRLVVLFLDLIMNLFLFSVILYLFGEESQVLQVVLFPELLLVNCNYILLLLLPSELFSLEFPRFFYLLALGLESLVGKVVGFLQVLNVLLTLQLGMVVDLEWSLRPHEVRVGLRVVAA